MDFERTHRSGSSELFICFTSRPSSTSSLMKIPSSKSIRSPGHRTNKSREPTLSISSSRRILKSNGSLKAGQFSPMMFPTGSSKKRGCAFETPEPSSPKVTCIGQVRVKTKKQGKKMLARRKRNPNVSFEKTENTQDGILHHQQQQQQQQNQNQQQHSCLPYRNQKWVHFPFTICEALKSFGADLNCFLPCGRSSCSPSVSEREKEEKRRTAASAARWLMTSQEGEMEEDEKRRDQMEMVFGADEEEEVERENVMMMEGGKGEAQEDGDEKRVSICLPPKNALLLMRCRSDPSRVAALASRFWDSPDATKEDDDDEYDDGDSEEEEMHTELEEKQKLVEVMEKWSADEDEENSEDGENSEDSLKEEQQEDVRVEEEEEKELEKNEAAMANGSFIEVGENPTVKEEEIILQEEYQEVEDNTQAVENPRTKEEPMVEEIVEDIDVLESNIEFVENPRILLEEKPMLQEVLEEDQEVVEHHSESVETPRIKKAEPMLQEILQEDQTVENNTKAVENPKIEEPMLEEVEKDQVVVEHKREAVENSGQKEQFMLQEVVVEEEEEEGEEEQALEHNTKSVKNLSLSCLGEEPNLQETIIGVEEMDENDPRSSEAVFQHSVREESEPALATEEEEEEEEIELGSELEERVEKSAMEEKEMEHTGGLTDEETKSTQEKPGITVKDEQEESIHENEREATTSEQRQTESKKMVLPDCMMWMMMCEPKLSMEVSKETWLCNRDFIRSWRHYDDDARPPQAILNSKVAIDVQNKQNQQREQQQQQRPLSSSCSMNPGGTVVLSMASMIEQKLLKAVAYQPMVLMRCKSAPIRSSIRLAPES